MQVKYLSSLLTKDRVWGYSPVTICAPVKHKEAIQKTITQLVANEFIVFTPLDIGNSKK